MSRRYTEIRCSSQPSTEIEIVTFEGKDHLVVPVIALVGDSVIQASNAPTPEFIPASVVEDSVITWNGRPGVPSHPKKNGKAISANNPKTFDSSRMGFIFESEFVDNKLKVLAYLDIARCNDIGGDAKLAIDKLQAGEVIDISIGAIVDTEENEGVSPSGESYSAVWTNLSGDHLAFLPSSIGACSQEMGCGANRIAEGIGIAIETSSTEIRTMSESNTIAAPAATSAIAVDRAAEPKRDFFSRLLTKFRPAVIFDDGNSDDELRQSLADAIKAIDPAFDWVCAVYLDSKVVIYMTYIVVPREAYGMYKYWRRTYSLDDTGKKITINNDAIEVQPKRVWETVDEGVEITPRESGSIVGAENRLRAACECGSQSQSQERTMAMNERTETINKLVAAGKFEESDRKMLEGMKDNAWKTVSETIVEAPAAASSASTSTVTAASAAPFTEADVFKALPDFERIITNYRAAESTRKDSLVTQLSTAQRVYDEAALKAKTLPQLEEIAALVGLDTTPAIDYSLRGLPQDPGAEARAAASPPPDGYMAALNKNKQAAN